MTDHAPAMVKSTPYGDAEADQHGHDGEEPYRRRTSVWDGGKLE
jgi:hypothetical protein